MKFVLLINQYYRMKNTVFYLLSMLLILTSCMKDGAVTGAEEGFFKCEINGTTFEKEGLLAYAVTSSIDGGVTIYGTEDVLEEENPISVYIIIDDEQAVGTYDLGGDLDGNGYYVDVNGSFTFYTIPEGAGGQIEITKKTEDRIAGTFSYTAIDPNTEEVVNITNGSFDVEIRF